MKRASQPPAREAPPPRADSTIVVGRGVQRRLDVTLVHGSILDVTTRALVLGSFRSVDPGGAAKAVDERLDGSLRELIRSRTVSSEPGSVFVLPTTRSGLRTDMVIFAGLGQFDHFDPSMIELVASNLVRTLVRGNVEEFATVLFGAGSGFDAAACTRHFMRGVFGGLRDIDVDRRFRGFTICELDARKYAAIKDQVYSDCRDDFCGDFDIVVRERSVPSSAPPPGAIQPPPDKEPLYLLVRTGTNSNGRALRFNAAILTAGGKAAVLEGSCEFTRTELDGVLAVIESTGFGPTALGRLGQRLASLVLPPDVRAELVKGDRRHLVVVHDLEAARVPWETLRFGKWIPALAGGMSRRYMASDLAIGRWAEHRERQKDLELLLLVNPTDDLPGATLEADRIAQFAATDVRVRVTRMDKKQVTRAAVLEQLQSERFDVIHYAGHAFFDPRTPGHSGIQCADGTLRALDLMKLRSLPPLLFLNACEAARVRGGRRRSASRQGARRSLGEAVGFAEALMRYGVANFVGTYWPVGDAAAPASAQEFEGAPVGGGSIGARRGAGRTPVQTMASVDWADYIHYGDPRFRLKR